MRRTLGLFALAGLAACQQPATDPAEGGFFAGISGIASGSYEAGVRAEASETRAAAARNAALRAESAALQDQIAATEADLARARLTLLSRRDAARGLSPDMRDRVNRTLLAEPSAATGAERLDDLRRLVAETRALSEELAGLSG